MELKDIEWKNREEELRKKKNYFIGQLLSLKMIQASPKNKK